MGKIEVKVNGKVLKVEENTTLLELSKEFEGEYPILVALVDNEICDLDRKVTRNCSIDFLTILSKDGFRAYQNSVAFLMICATKEVFDKETKVIIKHSIGKNYYCEIETNKEINLANVNLIKEKMMEKVDRAIHIQKVLLPVQTAMEYAKDEGMLDKVEVLKYRRGSNVHMYKLDWFYNYFYGQLVMQCEKLGLFDLEIYEKGIIIKFPDQNSPKKILDVVNIKKVLDIFEESDEWTRILNIHTVGNLNKAIVNNSFGDVIRVSEALHEKKIAEIADLIHDKNSKIVLVAGPSSSGKTTFAHRLSVQLKVNKLIPHVISLDDYYLDRTDIPFDEDGKQNFEVVESLDINMINNHLERLLKGETVEIPRYNFAKGIKEYKGNFLRLGENDIIVMEGIHGLNDIITKTVLPENKFKVFISCLTQLSVDDHNRIPTTDTRLIRRIVRDNKYRGFSPVVSLKMWPEVLKGEIENIFPYQNEADVVFNSALVYELSVLKPLIEAALFGVTPDIPEYSDARRLLKFLENFVTGDSSEIPNNSLVREFLGGSVFR